MDLVVGGGSLACLSGDHEMKEHSLPPLQAGAQQPLCSFLGDRISSASVIQLP